MRYSKIGQNKKRKTYTRLITELHHALNIALDEEHKRRGLTVSQIAKILGKDKSFVHRKFNGADNMTMETLAELAYALDRPVRVSLPSRHPVGHNGTTAASSFSRGTKTSTSTVQPRQHNVSEREDTSPKTNDYSSTRYALIGG